MSKKMGNLNTIDLVKFVLCICIIALHTDVLMLLPQTGELYFTKMFVRLAVPFFFVTSGFLLGCKIYSVPEFLADSNNLKDVIKKRVKRLLLPLIVISVYVYISRFIMNVFVFKTMSVNYAVKRTVRGIVFYPAGAMWYVQATIIAMLLLYFFIKHDKLLLVPFFGGILYVVAMMANSYYSLNSASMKSLINKLYYYCSSFRNGFTVGFLFIGLGLIIVRYKLHEINIKYIVTAAIISYITLFLEAVFTNNRETLDDASLYVSFTVLIPSLVILCSRIKLKDNLPYVKLRMLSVGMFFIHVPVLEFLSYIDKLLKLNMSLVILFLATVSICLCLCLFSYRLKNEFLLKLTS